MIEYAGKLINVLHYSYTKFSHILNYQTHFIIVFLNENVRLFIIISFCSQILYIMCVNTREIFGLYNKVVYLMFSKFLNKV